MSEQMSAQDRLSFEYARKASDELGELAQRTQAVASRRRVYVRRLYEAGYSLQTIADQLNITKSAVQKITAE